MTQNNRKSINEFLLKWIDQNRNSFTNMADRIWEYAELPWKEFKSSKIQADYLEEQGFKITWDLAGMNTAFSAEWGQGNPVIGFAGEYDALKGLSQKVQTSKEPLEEGAPGHGCGHNLLGTGCVAAVAAVKAWMEQNGKSGTLIYYGCPAEEGGAAKAFMARTGVFDRLDAAFNYHPGSFNMPTKGSAVGVNHMSFRFFGKTAHAGEAPHLGRSALDAVTLMNVGVNFLREHVTEDVRLHYSITHGGDLPNVVPDFAEVRYYIRAHDTNNLENVTNRVRDIVQGAALMTGTRWEEKFESASSAVLNNHTLADLQYEAMQAVGPMKFTDEEICFAEEINQTYTEEMRMGIINEVLASKYLPDYLREEVESKKENPLLEMNFPSLDKGVVETGSTDVGDLSQVVPLSMLYTTCFVTGAPGHNWSNVATGGMSIGHKGMLHAAKVMSLTAAWMFDEPSHLKAVRKEFEDVTKGKPYRCLIPNEVSPPQYENPVRGVKVS